MHARAGLDQHRAGRGQHHLGVGRAEADAERVEHRFDVGDDLVLLLAVARQQLLVVVDEVGADAQLVVAPDLGDVVDAVPADRVDEELRALQQLLDQQLLVGAVQGVGTAEVRGEGGLDRGRVVRRC